MEEIVTPSYFATVGFLCCHSAYWVFFSVHSLSFKIIPGPRPTKSFPVCLQILLLLFFAASEVISVLAVVRSKCVLIKVVSKHFLRFFYIDQVQSQDFQKVEIANKLKKCCA